MADLIHQYLLTSVCSLFTLFFWVNPFFFSGVIGSDLTDIRCGQKSLCRYRYPIIQNLSDQLMGPPDDSGWNTTAVDDDLESLEWCRCDRECGIYGDCCADAVSVYNFESNLTSSPWTCLLMTTDTDHYASDQNFYMYVIGNCPARGLEEDELLAILCQRQKHPEMDYFYILDIPVLSLITNRTYANIYCARCHNDSQQLAQWDISIQCNKNISDYNVTREQIFHFDNYRPGKRNWVLHDDGVTLDCDIVIEKFRQPTIYLKSAAGRRCVPTINNCTANWSQNTAHGHKCGIYTIHEESFDSEEFKDLQCANCNNTSATTGCLDQVISPSTNNSSIGRKMFSFSIIMDWNFGEIQVGRNRKCGPNEVYDPLHETCYTCGAKFMQQAGICIPRFPEQESYNAMWLNSSCPRIKLIKNVDYYTLNNGSLVLNKTQRNLHPGDYELGTNGYVEICADYSFQSYLDHLKNYLKYSYAQRYLSNVCLTISAICLAFHIAIHIAVPKLRNLPGKNLLSLSCALLLGQLLFLTGVGARDTAGYGGCVAIAAMIHWSIMSAFFWMNIMGFDTCRTFAGSQIKAHRHHSSVQRRRTTFRFYSLYAWGCPTLIVALSLALDFTEETEGSSLSLWRPDYGAHQCWICNKNGLGLFFVLPMATLLAVNAIFFGITAFSIVKQWRESQFVVKRKHPRRSSGMNNLSYKLATSYPIQKRKEKTRGRLQQRFFLYVKLAMIMGLGWISGFAAGLADIPGLWYPFILFNTLQGAFIFLAFDCKRKVYYLVYEALTKRPHPSNFSSSARGFSNVNKPATTTQVINTNTSSSLQPDVSVLSIDNN